MRKLLITAVALVLAMSANAQYLNDSEKVFNQGKTYFSAGLSGLDLNYNEENKLKLDLSAKAGYMFLDDWMLYANVNYHAQKDIPNLFRFGAGVRYYFERNGIYLGAGANYVHAYGDYDDVIPSVHVGYAFFISRTVTIEPEVYYDQSLKKHSDFSGLGLRLNFGIYLDDLF